MSSDCLGHYVRRNDQVAYDVSIDNSEYNSSDYLLFRRVLKKVKLKNN